MRSVLPAVLLKPLGIYFGSVAIVGMCAAVSTVTLCRQLLDSIPFHTSQAVDYSKSRIAQSAERHVRSELRRQDSLRETAQARSVTGWPESFDDVRDFFNFAMRPSEKVVASGVSDFRVRTVVSSALDSDRVVCIWLCDRAFTPVGFTEAKVHAASAAGCERSDVASSRLLRVASNQTTAARLGAQVPQLDTAFQFRTSYDSTCTGLKSAVARVPGPVREVQDVKSPRVPAAGKPSDVISQSPVPFLVPAAWPLNERAERSSAFQVRIGESGF